MLARRDHAEAEVARKLGRKSFSAEAAQSAVERLKRLGYLDDRRFALCFAESAVRNGRGWGARLKMELFRRGVDPALIAETLAETGAAFDEGDTIRELVERKFPSFSPAAADDRERRRVTGYLLRRGFSMGFVMRVVGRRSFEE